jgi:hypothetical protein
MRTLELMPRFTPKEATKTNCLMSVDEPEGHYHHFISSNVNIEQKKKLRHLLIVQKLRTQIIQHHNWWWLLKSSQFSELYFTCPSHV